MTSEPDIPAEESGIDAEEPLVDAGESVEADSPADAGPTVEEQLAERTADLQRLQAEYLNYKKRVDRDRDSVRQGGEAAVLQALLTTLDDIRRADEHGELEGGFKSVADSIQAVVARFGLEAYGAKGEPFDPQLHEAVFHAGESADVEVTSIDTVMLVGYKIGDRVLRAATVGVIDPAGEPQVDDTDPTND